MDEIKNYLEPGGSLDYDSGSWRVYKPIFDYPKCIKCKICEKVCPEGVCYFNQENNSYDADLDYCKGCGLCARHCPVKIISMEFEEK